MCQGISKGRKLDKNAETHDTRVLLELGQLLHRLPEDHGAGDVDVERANEPTLRNLYTVVNLVEQFYRTPLPLLAEEKKGLGGEDKVLKGNTLLRLLHSNYPPTI